MWRRVGALTRCSGSGGGALAVWRVRQSGVVATTSSRSSSSSGGGVLCATPMQLQHAPHDAAAQSSPRVASHNGGNAAASSYHGHYRPFSADDEAQLASVLTTKPRHVARHIRQSMQQSRRRVVQFRNAVTYLMILLQSRLQRREMPASDATAIIESLMRECVELRQGDMAHLLFRAAVRFRKYGLHVRYALVRHLCHAYRHDNAKELMKSMADEMHGDDELRLLAVQAYLFSGHVARALELLARLPRDQALCADDYAAVLEGLGATRRYDDVCALTRRLLVAHTQGDHADTAHATTPDVATTTTTTTTTTTAAESAQSGDAVVDVTAVPLPAAGALDASVVVSAAVLALAGTRAHAASAAADADADEAQARVVSLALQYDVPLSDAAVGAVLRARLRTAAVTCVADVYDVERDVRAQLRLPTLGVYAETAVIAKCTEVMVRTHEKGDAVMLQKVQHLQSVVDLALDNDQSSELDALYTLSLIRGYGALGQFAAMRACFDKLRDAGAVSDHRLYDEMMRWYARAYNLKEVIALKEEMTARRVFHTAQTYHNVFRVLDRYYPRMVEKYVSEMRAKGMHPEGFMYPTLVRVYGELHDYHTVESLYREAKAKAAQGDRTALTAALVVQMLKLYRDQRARCDGVIADAELHGLLVHEPVQTAILQLYSMSERPDELRGFLARVPHTSANMYAVLLRDAARRRDRAAFTTLLQEMQAQRVALNERVFSVVVTGYSQFGDAEGVRAYMQRALASEQVHTPMFFADAAAAYGRLGDMAAVEQCWRDLLQSKLVLTMPVYNRFLDLYMTHNHLTMVQEILDTMMKLVPPNPVTATTVIDMLGKMGRFREMESVLDEMARSANAAPTLVTYHHAMNAYAKCGDVAQMEAMRERLRRAGFSENHVTYNILFDGYGRAKRYESLHELIAERKRRGIAMEEFGYLVLLNIYARAHLARETEALVEDMLSSGIAFSSRVLATVASSFSVVGNVAQTAHYVNLLLAHPECRQRDVESVFLIYARLRDTVKLQELLDTAKLVKSELVYNVCVSAFAKAGEHGKVAFLLTQMEAQGYTLSRSASVTLSSLLLKAGKLELAQTVLRWKGLQPGHSHDVDNDNTDNGSSSSSDRVRRSDGSGGGAGEHDTRRHDGGAAALSSDDLLLDEHDGVARRDEAVVDEQLRQEAAVHAWPPHTRDP